MALTDDNKAEDRINVPVALQQELPRKVRLGSRGIYYLCVNLIFAAFLVTFVVMDVISAEKIKRTYQELTRDGLIVSTADVRAVGPHSATVDYTFMYDGNQYQGEAFLPHRYLDKVPGYSKSGGFRVKFLPRDPSINHPNDWRDDESYSILSYIFTAIVAAQVAIFVGMMSRDWRLARKGMVTVGRVTGCRRGRNGGIYLKYEFRDADDIPTQGRGEYPNSKELGSQICVVYLPEESSKSRPYPLVFFVARK